MHYIVLKFKVSETVNDRGDHVQIYFEKFPEPWLVAWQLATRSHTGTSQMKIIHHWGGLFETVNNLDLATQAPKTFMIGTAAEFCKSFAIEGTYGAKAI